MNEMGSKRSNGAAVFKPRKKMQAVSKTSDPSILSLMATNVTKSPLLGLPAEIQSQILRLLLGDRMVHIKFVDGYTLDCLDYGHPPYDSGRKAALRYAICTVEQSESSAHDDVCAGKVIQSAAKMTSSFNDTFQSRHDDCGCGWLTAYTAGWRKHEERYNAAQIAEAEGGQEKKKEKKQKKKEKEQAPEPFDEVHLSILSVSRQLYGEGKRILYSTNIFTFESPKAFSKTMDSLNTSQRRLLSHVNIWSASEHRGNTLGWSRAFTPTRVAMFKNLKTIQISYDMRINLARLFEKFQGIGDKDLYEDFKESYTHRMADFDHLRRINPKPKSVRVMITNSKDPRPRELASRLQAIYVRLAKEYEAILTSPPVLMQQQVDSSAPGPAVPVVEDEEEENE